MLPRLLVAAGYERGVIDSVEHVLDSGETTLISSRLLLEQFFPCVDENGPGRAVPLGPEKLWGGVDLCP